VSREEFLQANPNKSYLYDEIEAENVEMKNRLTDAKNKRDAGGFNYTDEELKSIGYKPEEIKILKQAAKINPVAAHQEIIKRINRIPQTRKLNAAMLGKIGEALLVDVMEEKDYDYDDDDEVREAKAIASKRAIEIEEFMSGGLTFDKAVEAFFAKDSAREDEGRGLDVESELAELLKKLQNEAD